MRGHKFYSKFNFVLSSLRNVFHKISADSRPKLVAGSSEGYSGHVDGKPREARMNHPKGHTVDERGNIYVADTTNMAIRKISDAGNLMTKNLFIRNTCIICFHLMIHPIHSSRNQQCKCTFKIIGSKMIYFFVRRGCNNCRRNIVPRGRSCRWSK